MRIVVKVGTSTLAHPGGLLNIRHTEDLVRVWSDIQNAGHQLIVVSSAATGLGAGKLQIEKPGDLVTKPAPLAWGWESSPSPAGQRICPPSRLPPRWASAS